MAIEWGDMTEWSSSNQLCL